MCCFQTLGFVVCLFKNASMFRITFESEQMCKLPVPASDLRPFTKNCGLLINMVRTVSMANTFRRLGEDEDHSTIFQEVMQLNGNAQQVVSRIQMRQDMRELGRFVARHDILEACNYVARIEGHLSERFVRWCIAIHFDFDAEYGFYTLKRHRDLDRLFIDTTNGASQAVLPLSFVMENLRIQRTLQN